jgi:sortase (surface protein transpeptidase)
LEGPVFQQEWKTVAVEFSHNGNFQRYLDTLSEQKAVVVNRIERMEIPRLHLSVAILEGTAPKTLLAAGHINGTPLPGTAGNTRQVVG